MNTQGCMTGAIFDQGFILFDIFPYSQGGFTEWKGRADPSQIE